MIVGFGGTLMSLFGGETLMMEYLEFVVMLIGASSSPGFQPV